MRTLRSYVQGQWHQADRDFRPLVNPCTEETIAQASSSGVDYGAALEFASTRGGPALREASIEERGGWLLAMAKAIHAERDALIALSLENTGTTRKDAKFDLDGATYALSHYGRLGQQLGNRMDFIDGEGIQLGQSPRFWGQHVLVPLAGCAVHINAFNFPAWGFAEKAACALLAGMPVITKPATSSAWVAERCVEIVLEAGILPAGALSMICGSTGDLLDQLGAQDVLAFTGSAATAQQLRGKPNLLNSSTRVNVEADSLNAAVLGPDVETDSETFALFLRDVHREMTQKSGQKCTAVRRIFVSDAQLEAVQEELIERLSEVVVGDPHDERVTMGPLATAQQLQDAVEGVAKLREQTTVVHGTGDRVDGVGGRAGCGYYFGPTLMRASDPRKAPLVHQHEVFGPAATLFPYSGQAGEAAEFVALAGGTLVTSVYSDDKKFLQEFLRQGGGRTGRLYMGSEKVSGQLPGSGAAMPHLLHGGPGRAGGGSELGGMRGLELYLQRMAVSGDRALVERITGLR